MNFYNTYFRDSNTYRSKIAFVDTVNGNFILKQLYYIQFSNIAKDTLNCKDGFYLDNNKFLYNLYNKARIKNTVQEFLKNSDNYIINAQPTTRIYVYIKIIEDKQNPQLEGETMLFFFGYQMRKKVVQNNLLNINNIFILDIKYSFLNFDTSEYLDKSIYVFDNNLDLNNEPLLNFPIINIIKIQRKAKLLKLREESSSNLISDLLVFGWNISFINNNEKITWKANNKEYNIESDIEFDTPIDCIIDIYEKILNLD